MKRSVRWAALAGLAAVAGATAFVAGAKSSSTPGLAPPTPRSPAMTPRAVIDAFLAALAAADLDGLMQLFTRDATIFVPTKGDGLRQEGIGPIRAIFAEYFDELRAKKDAPPYVTIEPDELMVQDLGGGVTVVTFESDRAEGGIARRTFVLRRSPGGAWRIAHMHASNAAPPRRP